MRVFRLILLCLLAYAGTMLVLFPASPIIKRVEPLIKPVELSGVSGKLYAGKIARVLYNDDVFPVTVTDASSRLLPRKLLQAAAGVRFDFKAYGGIGDGDFEYRYNGDITLRDVHFTGPAKNLEELLPLPIATFGGQLAVQAEIAEVKQQLLRSLRATIDWNNAILETPVRASLGNISIDVKPIDDQTHRAFVNASGGEVEIDGTADLKLNGDFSTDINVIHSSSATPELVSALRGLGRADRDGRYRVRQTGNVNRLM